jgi:nicotinamidase-related amidase
VVVNTPLIREWVELGAWQEGTWGVDFVDGLGPEGDEFDEFVVTHTRNSGFHNSTLADVLAGLSVRRLICCGVSTAYTVESTVRQAVDIGFDVTVAADACSTGTERQPSTKFWRRSSFPANISSLTKTVTASRKKFGDEICNFP